MLWTGDYPVDGVRSWSWPRSPAVLASCGDSDGTTDATNSTTTSQQTTTTTTAPDNTTTSQQTTTTSPAPNSTTTSQQTTTTSQSPDEPLPDSELPGTNFDLSPVPGAVLSVIGVAHDDVLNLRRAPGTDQPIVGQLDNLADDLVASGRARMLSSSIWWEVTTADGSIGWVSSSFTARRGPVFDHTSVVVDLIGSIPSAETMLELGEIVANSVSFSALDDPDIPTRVVLAIPPTVGDLGEVTYDAVGLADDSSVGMRLHVFGQPLESGEGFSLKSVEATDMCDPVRGDSPPGELCV